jgi:ureidoacrylate peracid hydrolase
MVQSSREIPVHARPAPLAIDPRDTAVVVVDMQQGFFGPGGAWDRAGIDVSGAQGVVAPTARVLAAARDAGLPIVYLTMGFAGPGGDTRLWNRERRERWVAVVGPATPAPHGRTLPAGVTDADILAELAPHPGDVVVVKSRHSGFFNTDLHAILQGLGVTTLVFTGGTTSICVEATLRDAYFRDYRCLLLADCVAEPIGGRLPRTNHDATLLLVEVIYGWVAESPALVQALTAQQSATDTARIRGG